jgi:hypothetical protein
VVDTKDREHRPYCRARQLKHIIKSISTDLKTRYGDGRMINDVKLTNKKIAEPAPETLVSFKF